MTSQFYGDITPAPRTLIGGRYATETPEYRIWATVRQRCLDKNYAQYPRYGGRGISICDRWRESFLAFYEDMGARPGGGYSIDRINNAGSYEPGNCRWASAETQAENKRDIWRVEFSGGDVSLRRFAEIHSLPVKTVRLRRQFIFRFYRDILVVEYRPDGKLLVGPLWVIEYLRSGELPKKSLRRVA